jgi:hypothetical protein
MGVDICITHEDIRLITIWKFAKSEGGSSWPEWREETQRIRTSTEAFPGPRPWDPEDTQRIRARNFKRPRASDPAINHHKKDTVPQATAQKELHQCRVPLIKSLLHKLLCTRAE